MGDVGKGVRGGGGMDHLCPPFSVHQKSLLGDEDTEEGEERRESGMQSIPGGTSRLQSRPGECADRVGLRHGGASVIHPDKPYDAAQERVAQLQPPKL